MTWTIAITLSVAVLGAVLGIINTWAALDRNKVKLKVIPMTGSRQGNLLTTSINAGEGKTFIVIEVHNLSAFPVTISEVGFLYHGTRRRGAMLGYEVVEGKRLPRRLDLHSSFSVFNYVEAIVESGVALGKIKCAYVKTDCDILRRGNSPALKTLVRETRRAGG